MTCPYDADVPVVPAVSVVIPVRNGADLLPEQLDALAAQTTRDFEVVLSDNGSTDDTVAVARARADAVRLALRIVDSSERPGVCHARNVGIRHAAAAKVLICDADDVVVPGWVAAMASALDDHDIVCGRLDVDHINPPAVRAWSGAPPTDSLPMTMGFLPYAYGGNLGLRRAAVEVVGDFDPWYEGGHEEVDFSWRAQQAGLDIGFAPDAVIHYRLRDSLGGTVRQRFYYGRSYAQLYRRFHDAGVPRTPWRKEARFYLRLLRSLPRDVRGRRFGFWLVTAAWTAGRLAGDVRYRVRCPL